jgi:HAD superfamily hydrolase (TIGR01549 family)
MIAVTFDYGQTLAELDTEYLARRVAERGATVTRERLDQASPQAWKEYDAAKSRGETGRAAWSSFMRALLTGAGVRSSTAPGAEVTSTLVDFLWSEQPRNNLWRRAIAGMSELCADLSTHGVPLGIVSNSEGRLVELLDLMDLHRFFPVVADSGVLGVEKPDGRIFEYTAEHLEVETSDLIHVGDAWVADIEGALGVGARAIWITAEPGSQTLPPRVVTATTASDVRAALAAWGVL